MTKKTGKVIKEFNLAEEAIGRAVQILKKHKVEFDANTLFLFADLIIRNQMSDQDK